MISDLVFEVCVDSVASALAAQAGGAQRVELCANLFEGGTTPSAGTITLTRRHLEIGLQVIIRPRGGDFYYSELEFEVMKHDITAAKDSGADGVVIGLLLPDGTIDEPRTRELVALARPMNVTFHRAFDMVRDPAAALETLISLGINRVLTSGQEESVLEGLDLITALVRQAGDRIIIMPGGGITERNIGKITKHSGVKEVHFSSRVTVDSQMTYRNPHAFMGGTLRPAEFSQKVTSAERVGQFIRRAKE